MWQRIKCEGPPPNSRLDHTICAVTIPRETDGKYINYCGSVFCKHAQVLVKATITRCNIVVLGTEVKPTKFEQTFLIVFGGMDTRGEIFDDCLAFLVD